MSNKIAENVKLAKEVIERLRECGIDQDDSDHAELLDSECDLRKQLERMIRAAVMAEAQAEMLDGMITAMQARKARFADKAQRLRSVALWAMQESGLPRLDAPDFTAAIQSGRRAVIISDEDSLPDIFVRMERIPNKMALKKVLEGGASVPGATLSNGADYLKVMTR